MYYNVWRVRNVGRVGEHLEEEPLLGESLNDDIYNAANTATMEIGPRGNDGLESSDALNYSRHSIIILAFAGILALPTDTPITVTESEDSLYLIGRYFAWICTFLYLSSRLPQIYWNFKRKSVQGLALGMFACAVAGNVTYALSLLIKSTDPQFLYGALPFLLGTAGTVTFDFIIFAQYVLYSKASS